MGMYGLQATGMNKKNELISVEGKKQEEEDHGDELSLLELRWR